MKQEYQVLWGNIKHFKLDDPATALPFIEKLSRENKWPLPFARLAIAEYKKFLLLCCISPRGASPSQVVDKVWHLHLTYTHNYWEELCDKVLHKQLHYYPSSGGLTKDKKHQDWYNKTFALYIDVFDEIPTSAIWPIPIESELSVLAMDYKKSICIMPGIWLAVCGIIVLFILMTQLQFFILNPYWLYRFLSLDYMFLLFIHGIGITLLLLSSQRYGLRKFIDASFPETYMNYGVIELLHGETRALQTAILELVDYQLLEVMPSKNFISHFDEGELLPACNPLLPAVMQQEQFQKLHSMTFPNIELSYEDLKQLYSNHRPDMPQFLKIKWLSHQEYRWRWVPYRFISAILLLCIMQGSYYYYQSIGNTLSGMFLFTILYVFIVFFYSPVQTMKQVLRKKMTEEQSGQLNSISEDYVKGYFSNSGINALEGLENYALLASVFATAPDDSIDAGFGEG